MLIICDGLFLGKKSPTTAPLVLIANTEVPTVSPGTSKGVIVPSDVRKKPCPTPPASLKLPATVSSRLTPAVSRSVFPAMEMRRAFSDGDLNYLANLCHSCGACYTDCQFSPPHEFNVNVPQTLAIARAESYAAYAWPRAFAGLFVRNGLVISLIAAASMAAFSMPSVVKLAAAIIAARMPSDRYARSWTIGAELATRLTR